MSKPSVLTVYNAYLNRGGEDEVFEAEADLLQRHGHEVHRQRFEADELKDPGLMQRARLAVETVWSARSYKRFRDLVRELQPDVVHFHNTFPFLSPSVYFACKREGAVVVQTLHNYRLLCPKTTFYRDGAPCEDCLGRTLSAWPGIVHACYHDSASQTAVIAGMLAAHRLRGTWQDAVDAYITPTAFARRKFIEGGLPAHKVIVKPNFVDYEGPLRSSAGDYFLLVGRLVEHKGVESVLRAWSRLSTPIPLRIIGDGPLAGRVQQFADSHPEVTYLGRQSHDEVLAQMRGARALLFPSTWYETFGITIVEAYASGTPVIASDIGPVGEEIVDDGRTGMLFPPDDDAFLASLVHRAWLEPAAMQALGKQARREYEAKYTPARNYELLASVYEGVLSSTAPATVAVPA